jgi:site-specific DNA-methyltransferase (adenine-specific)
MVLPEPYYRDDAVTLYHGDCRDILPGLAAGSVDLVLTDPPYPREYLWTYGYTAEQAARLLKPGGFCLAYCGAEALPEIMTAMSSHLSWFWLFGIGLGGNAPRMWHKKVNVSTKPVVVWTNGPPDPSLVKWCWSDIKSQGGPEKSHHPWQQPVRHARIYIDARCPEGGVVLDPFAGAGTFLRAAKDTGRHAVGVEESEASCAAIVGRLAQSVLPLALAAD